MKVSIIIPTYNRAHLIGETLDSVLAQTYTNWECLVVDDGSADETEQLLNKYIAKDDRFQYHKRPDSHLSGGNGSRNYGFEVSKGEYIQWFDDDDVMLPEFLEIKTENFNEIVDFVICTGYKVNSQLVNRELVSIKLTENLYKDYALRKIRVLTPSVIFRKSFLVDKSLFSEHIKRGQETELFLRLFYTAKMHQYKIINKPLFLYRQHSYTKSSKGKSYNKDFIEGQTHTFVENIQKSIVLRDKDLLLFFYRLLVIYFVRGIEKKHKSNSRYILKSLISNVGKLSFTLKLELYILGNFLLFFNKNFYVIKMRLINNSNLKKYSF